MAGELSTLEESAWARAKRDSRGVITSPPFYVASGLVGAIAAAVAAVVTADPATPSLRVGGWAALAALLGVAISVIGVIAIQYAAAPIRQRDEARRGMRNASSRSAPDPQALESARTLKVAITQVTEELEHVRGVLDEDPRSYFARHKLAVGRWEEHNATLAAGPTEAHAAARSAYRKIDAVNRSIDIDYTMSDGLAVPFLRSIDVPAIEEAKQLVDVALVSLANALSHLD